MESLRILLVALPRLMSDMLRVALDRQPGLEVVGVLDAVAGLPRAAHTMRPDLVVVGLRGTRLPAECAPAFAERPQLRVVGIDEDAAEAGIYELRPHRIALGALTPDELATAIARAARSPMTLEEVG